MPINKTNKIIVLMYLKNVIDATQCLRTLASPKGRGGMLSGRLKYIIKKKRFLRSFYGGRRLQDIVNSASKFNSIVVKTLKPVLCSSRDSVPLKFKKQTWRQYSLSMQIV